MKNLVTWQILKKKLGYTKEEMKQLRANPRYEKAVSKFPGLMKKKLVLEVVESHGCISQHKEGDRLIFDAFGNLQTRKCPDQVCVFLLGGAQNLLYAGMELLLAGADPNEMVFSRTSCVDVGLECGGWGKVIVEIKSE